MTEEERNLKSNQIQKMLGEHYGTVGRSENYSIAEEIVKLFYQPDVSVTFCNPPNITYCKQAIRPDFDCDLCKWKSQN